MTRDEAIKILQTEMECVSRPDCDRLACAYCDLAMRAEDVLTAYQMAITALQTDGDCISRQAAIDALVNKLDSIDHVPQWVFDELTGVISELPSAQPEPCDAISRADAIRVASGYCHPANVAKELAKLPSVQAERKTGKWKMALEQDLLGFNTVCFHCSECNGVEYSTPPFCRMCGAKMEDGDHS